MSGTIKTDDTFIGRAARNLHQSKRESGIHGSVPLEHVGTRRKSDLNPVVRKQVRRGFEVMTDELLTCDGLDSGYAQKVINHTEKLMARFTRTAWKTSGVS